MTEATENWNSLFAVAIPSRDAGSASAVSRQTPPSAECRGDFVNPDFGRQDPPSALYPTSRRESASHWKDLSVEPFLCPSFARTRLRTRQSQAGPQRRRPGKRTDRLERED